MSKEASPKAYETQQIDGRQVVTWRQLRGGEKGATLNLPSHAGLMVEISGAFGTTGSAALEGSVSGGSFALIEDDRGRAIYASRPIMCRSKQAPRLIRPYVLGDDKTAVNISVCF